MTDDDGIVVSIQAGDGLDNKLKIRNTEDLQVAIESLQLAARYEFSEDISFGDSGEDIQELKDFVERLEEELNGVEEDVGTLIEEVGDAVDKEVVEELAEQVEGLDEKIERGLEESLSPDQGGNEDSESCTPTDGNKESEDKTQDPEVESEEDEKPDLSSKTIPEIVEEQLVDVESPPYSYDEFKDFSYTEQQAAIYAQLLLIQPATKEEVAGALIKGEPGTAETQYIYQRLDDLSPHIDKRRRPSNSPRDPYEYAGEGFDLDDTSNSVDNSTEDEEEDVDDSSDQERSEGAYSFEWKTIDEAVDEYRNDSSKKFLLCIRSMKSYASPSMAQNHSEEGEGAVWAASEELPDDFVQ